MKANDVIIAFINSRSASGSNIYSTGDKLFSYNTCIAEWNYPCVIRNITKYSSTTSRRQNYLYKCIVDCNLPYLCKSQIPLGTTRLI